MAKKQRVYTAEFKQEAVRLMETSGKSIAQLARDLGVSDSAAGEKVLFTTEIKRFREKVIKQSLKKNCVASNVRMKSCVKSVTF